MHVVYFGYLSEKYHLLFFDIVWIIDFYSKK